MSHRPPASPPAPAAVSRRGFLLGGLGAITVLGLGPSAAPRRAAAAPVAEAPGGGIRVDLHSRLFNGQDVHLAELLAHVVAPAHPAHADLIRAGAGVAQAMAWLLAPSGAAETRRLDEMARHRGPALASGDGDLVRRERREADRRFRDALPAVLSDTEFLRLYLERLMAGARAALGPAAAARLARMAGSGRLEPADVDFLLGPDSPERTLLSIRPLAAFRRYTYSRYLSAAEVLGPDGGIADLVVPTGAVADGGSRAGAPPTPPHDQLIALARLATLGGGRLHPLAPFDPRGGGDAPAALAMVRQAVEQRGFAGVTITGPPGGVTARHGRLRALLEWCEREEVAVVLPAASAAMVATLLAHHPGLRLGIRAESPAALDAGSARGRSMRGLDWMRRSIDGDARELGAADAAGHAAPEPGRAAADFLGLDRGRRTRARLEAFYDRHRVPPPAWMRALDASRPNGSARG